MAVFSWRGLVTPNFQRPLAAKLCVRPGKVFEVQERARGPLSPCQVWWGWDFTRRRGGQKRSVFCLSVCRSCFWTSDIVRPTLRWRRWSTETILMPLDRERFAVVHPCSTFSDCRQLSTPLNVEVQKNGKIWGVSPSEGDRINRSSRILARKRDTVGLL